MCNIKMFSTFFEDPQIELNVIHDLRQLLVKDIDELDSL